MKTRVAVVGAGAIGSYAAAHMTRAGEDVTVVDQYPEHVERMRTSGLQISGVTERDNFSVKMNALHVADVQTLANQRPIDIAIVTIKSYDTPWATRLIQPYLAPNGFVVSMQNGLNDETIAGIVGWGKTLGVTISGCGVELYAPGRVKRTNSSPTGHSVYRVGEIHGRTTERAQEVVRVLSAADGAKVTNNLWGERWSKLIINAMRNGLASITDVQMPEQDENDITRAIMIRLGSETVRVGQALGFELVTTQGMQPETLARAGEGDEKAAQEIKTILINFVKQFVDLTRPSMAQDVAKKRRTEIDEINGLVVERGTAMGVPTPINEKMVELVKRVERGELTPSLDVVQGLL